MTTTTTMKYNPDIHHRKSIRLHGYDYTQAGLYFITICTHDRMPLLGDVIDAETRLNEAGLMVERCWRAIPEHFPSATLDEFIVMPNHLHGIISISENDAGANLVGQKFVGAKNLLPLQSDETPQSDGTPQPDGMPQSDGSPQPKHGTSRTIGSIVRGFKIGVTKWFRGNTDVHLVWQRNYYEHIIRNEEAYLKIAEYIQTNPQRWKEDTYYV